VQLFYVLKGNAGESRKSGPVKGLKKEELRIGAGKKEGGSKTFLEQCRRGRGRTLKLKNHPRSDKTSKKGEGKVENMNEKMGEKQGKCFRRCKN